MATKRKYPVGVQSFEKLRKEGYLYVDKTPLIYKMITEGCPYFLSRPRRFGKSLLVSTLAAVFEGRRELFEAFTTKDGIEQPQLFIATTDWEWEKYPVIRFDFSSGDLSTIEQLDTLNDETLAELKRMYDGYHFSKRMTDMYNPFSMVKALKSGEIEKYWFDSATPSALIDMLRQMPPLEISDVDGVTCESDAFDQSFDSYKAPLPVLYQSGYLTIRNYIKEDDIFILGFPNSEVRTGFAGSLYRYVTDTTADNRDRSALMTAYKAFRRTDDLPAFIEAIKAFFASIPYQWEKDNKNEHYYHALLYTLLTSFGADVRAEEPTAKGQSDLTLLMPRGIYVMEIKYNHTAQEALDQISRKGYADKYALDGRPVTKVGISFSSEERNITEWKQEKA